MKIKVCIPYYSEYEACKKGIQELESCADHEFVIVPMKCSVVSDGRNFLVDEGASTKTYHDPISGYDAFLFIDSDIEFTLKNVLVLIGAKKPISALPYETFNGSGIYQVGTWNLVEGNIGMKYSSETSGWKRVDWIGGGMHLVMAHVYAKTEYPWYRHHLVQYRGNQQQTSEDLGFCIMARKAGFNIWCNFDYPVNHTKEETINEYYA